MVSGVAILFSTYVVLYFINPELVRLRDPELPAIDITVPGELLGVLRRCQELGNKTTCETYGKDVTACLNNACRVEGESCNIGPTGNCYSVKAACQKVERCDDYISAVGFGWANDRRNACEFDVCKKACDQKCFYENGGLF